MILNAHTFYSLRYGTLAPDKLARLAAKYGYRHMVLTDINNTSAVWDFVRACQQYGVAPVVGMELRHESVLYYLLIARNAEGLRQINQLRTECNLHGLPPPMPPPPMPDVWVVYPLGHRPTELAPNAFIGVRPSELGRLHGRAYRALLPRMVAWVEWSFAGENTYELHRHLRAIDLNTLLSHVPPEALAPEQATIQPPEHWVQVYAAWPDLWQRAADLAEGCSLQFDFRSPKNLACFGADAQADRLLLRRLASEGQRQRYGEHCSTAKHRVEQELLVIEQLGFVAYYLMAWDLVHYARSQHIPHVGRGSGANSIVAYCLHITDVDPVELDLYFERFINPHRASPPDFDIDFSWKDRNRIYDYLFGRYPAGHVALLGATNTFQGQSSLRELAKVYGLPDQEIERMSAQPTLMHTDPIWSKIAQVGQWMIELPNARSIHAGGVLVSERPLTYYTALDLPPKGYPTVQFDMYVAEAIGFEKLDILSQRGLGHIHEAVAMLRAEGVAVDIAQTEHIKTDPTVRSLLRQSRTIGCFYIESPAMRGLLTKLRCDNYLTLVAASSIIRPGVSSSGMMQEYIRRFHRPETIRYLHPILEQQLAETYGVMVYQEDVLKVCHHFAGLDLADADVLRRLMSGKPRYRNEAQQIVQKFFDNCAARGYSPQVSQEVWRQIESFAGYSFSKAHSASYAVESFQSLYLKAHYPLHFITAVLNNFGGFYRAEVYVNEARRLGAQVALPSVNHSLYLNRLQGTTLYLGFVYVERLETKFVERFIAQRAEGGAYLGLIDFVQRTAPSLEQLKILIQVGAFAFVGYSKAKLLWEAHLMLHRKPAQEHGALLFAAPARSFQIPDFEESALQHAWDEMELLGFPVSLSWFGLLAEARQSALLAHDLPRLVGQSICIEAQLVTTKYVRTRTGQTMRFGTFLDAEGQFVDTVHFPPSLASSPFGGQGVYRLWGKVADEFGHPSLEVDRMVQLPLRSRRDSDGR